MKKILAWTVGITALLIYANAAPTAKTFIHNGATAGAGAIYLVATDGVPAVMNAIQGGAAAMTKPTPTKPTPTKPGAGGVSTLP